MTIHYTPFLPEATTNPYPLYRRLLEDAPVYYIEEYDGWAISRFADVWAALEDAETFGTTRGSTAAQALSKVEGPVPSINQIDPPDHTRLRRAIKGAFTRNHLEHFEPGIRASVVRRIERGLDAGRLDVVRELADPIAGEVACGLLDLPPEDGAILTAWVHRYVENDPEDLGRSNDALAASMEMNEYLAEFAARWRRNPGRDGALVQAFLEFEIDGRRLTDLEVASHLQTIVIGGTDTTPKGIGAAVLRLHQNPGQRARLANERDRIPAAFHEVLRYDMPTQFMARTVMRPTEFQGQKLEPGQGVLMMLAAANRDPREFPDPDRFDAFRNPRRILSFGHAVHICLGAHVARLEGRIVLEELLRLAPDYRLDESEIEWRRADQIQGIVSAPITLEAG